MSLRLASTININDPEALINDLPIEDLRRQEADFLKASLAEAEKKQADERAISANQTQVIKALSEKLRDTSVNSEERKQVQQQLTDANRKYTEILKTLNATRGDFVKQIQAQKNRRNQILNEVQQEAKRKSREDYSAQKQEEREARRAERKVKVEEIKEKAHAMSSRFALHEATSLARQQMEEVKEKAKSIPSAQRRDFILQEYAKMYPSNGSQRNLLAQISDDHLQHQQQHQQLNQNPNQQHSEQHLPHINSQQQHDHSLTTPSRLSLSSSSNALSSSMMSTTNSSAASSAASSRTPSLQSNHFLPSVSNTNNKSSETKVVHASPAPQQRSGNNNNNSNRTSPAKNNNNNKSVSGSASPLQQSFNFGRDGGSSTTFPQLHFDQKLITDIHQRFPRNFIFEYADLSIENFIASGGGGKIYKVRIKNMNDREVAGKFFNDPESIAKSLKECEVALRLHHRNIVQSLGLCVMPASPRSESELLLLMELGECNLSTLLNTSALNLMRSFQQQQQQQQQPSSLTNLNNNNNNNMNTRCFLPFDICFDFARQIASGLAYLHSQKPKKILHLDIKFANVIVCDGGRTLKLCDLGLARETDHSRTDISVTGAGTARFLAPEGFTSPRIAATNDVYSFGCLLFTFITSRFPHEGLNFFQMATTRLIDSLEKAIQNSSSSSGGAIIISEEEEFNFYLDEYQQIKDNLPIRIRPGCPVQLIELCKECIQPDPTARPKDGVELVRKLVKGCEEWVASCANNSNNNKTLTNTNDNDDFAANQQQNRNQTVDHHHTTSTGNASSVSSSSSPTHLSRVASLTSGGFTMTNQNSTLMMMQPQSSLMMFGTSVSTFGTIVKNNNNNDDDENHQNQKSNKSTSGASSSTQRHQHEHQDENQEVTSTQCFDVDMSYT